MTSHADVPAEIRQNSKRFFEALVARDMRGIHALYAKDSKVLAPGSKIVSGPEAIEAFWIESMATMPTGHEVTTVETRMLGADHVLEIGTVRVMKNGEPHNGRYITIWQREDGEWKIALDSWN